MGVVRATVTRVATWTAGTLVLCLLAVWIWWRESGTAARWRFEDSMKSFCGGLLAYERSQLFEGLHTSVPLREDRTEGRDAYVCLLGERLTVVRVTLLRPGARTTGTGRRLLPSFDGPWHPAPLPGGWRGAADGRTIRLLLPCRDDGNAVSVMVEGYTGREDHAPVDRVSRTSSWRGEDVFWARFGTATATKAARRWGCEATGGEPLRKLPYVHGTRLATHAQSTCAGLPLARDERLDLVRETPVGRGALYERCDVWASAHFDTPYVFTAHFDLYARQERDDVRLPYRRSDAGAERNIRWASATCPGDSERALFTGAVPPGAGAARSPGSKGGESFGGPAFRAYAERAAARHRCWDLRLPSG
ncbi:hypothetical protein ACFWPV_12105 [Streptomyces uncialis]|uniref:hypothetical protein n=1 Tax=Streptomyces uncialis TaxID=1048205 RepID=UPI00366A2387